MNKNLPKILYFIDSFQTGGAETSVLEISRRMKNVEVYICVMYSDKDDLRSSFKENNIKIIDLNLLRTDRFWFINGKKRFEKVCKELQPEIVHAHLYKSEIIARISFLPKKTKLLGAFVNDSYSVERYGNQSFMQNLKLKGVQFIDRLTIKRNIAITSITNSIKITNCNALKYDAEKVKVIYRGRNSKNFVEVKRSFKQGEQFKFLLVGRLLERKGYFEFIKAVSLLIKESQVDFIFNVAGDGVDGEKIKKFSLSLGLEGKINFLGNQKDIPNLLSQSHTFIFASHYEGQGGSLVEAMLSGIPIIASDIDVFKEQVEESISAKFFKVKNSRDLADKMLWMLNNYEEALLLGSNARKRALELFDIEKIACQTEEFYLEMIQNG